MLNQEEEKFIEFLRKRGKNRYFDTSYFLKRKSKKVVLQILEEVTNRAYHRPYENWRPKEYPVIGSTSFNDLKILAGFRRMPPSDKIIELDKEWQHFKALEEFKKNAFAKTADLSEI